MADGVFAKELEDELMKYTRKDDPKVERNLVAKTEEVPMSGEVEVNITECTKSLGNKLVAPEFQDATESSSSFGHSNLSDENADTLSDSEVSSEFQGDAVSALDFNGFGGSLQRSVFARAASALDFNGSGESLRTRKKKLTAHWRSFIQPLMWRCKWAELQVNKLRRQMRRYDRELDAYNKQKQAQTDRSNMVDGVKSGVKSLPFLLENGESVVFKRKKRRRTEVTTDVAAYMSQHNLFSCYENRKFLMEGTFVNNESKNPATQKIKIKDDDWVNNELLSFEPGDGGSSLEHILLKIEFLQSKLGKVKAKADRIIRENTERLSYADSLNLSPPHNGNAIGEIYISSQIASLLAPQIAGTSRADFPVPNGSTDQALFGTYGSVEDGALIDNQKVKEERNGFEEVKIDPLVPTQMALDPEGGLGHTNPTVVVEPDPLEEDQSPPKIRSIAKLTAPKSKRKKGRKKASTSRRRRRTTG